MKFKVIKSSELSIHCWHPNRYLGLCYQCDRVKQCKLPEAKIGQIKLQRSKVGKAKEKLQEEKIKLGILIDGELDEP